MPWPQRSSDSRIDKFPSNIHLQTRFHYLLSHVLSIPQILYFLSTNTFMTVEFIRHSISFPGRPEVLKWTCFWNGIWARADCRSGQWLATKHVCYIIENEDSFTSARALKVAQTKPVFRALGVWRYQNDELGYLTLPSWGSLRVGRAAIVAL